MTFIHVVLLHLFLPPYRSLKFTHKAFLRFENKIYYLLKGNIIRFTQQIKFFSLNRSNFSFQIHSIQNTGRLAKFRAHPKMELW